MILLWKLLAPIQWALIKLLLIEQSIAHVPPLFQFTVLSGFARFRSEVLRSTVTAILITRQCGRTHQRHSLVKESRQSNLQCGYQDMVTCQANTTQKLVRCVQHRYFTSVGSIQVNTYNSKEMKFVNLVKALPWFRTLTCYHKYYKSTNHLHLYGMRLPVDRYSAETRHIQVLELQTWISRIHTFGGNNVLQKVRIWPIPPIHILLPHAWTTAQCLYTKHHMVSLENEMVAAPLEAGMWNQADQNNNHWRTGAVVWATIHERSHQRLQMCHRLYVQLLQRLFGRMWLQQCLHGRLTLPQDFEYEPPTKVYDCF